VSELPRTPHDVAITLGQMAGRVEGLVYALRPMAAGDQAGRLLNELESEAQHAKALAGQVMGVLEGGESRAEHGGQLDDIARLRHMRRNARSFANALLKTRRLEEASEHHEDRMLTWSVGLMGAALFALPGLLATACGGNRHLVVVAAPWASGVVLALIGRLVGGWYRNASAYRFAGRWGQNQALVVRPVELSTPAEFGREIIALMNETNDDLKASKERAERLNRWATRLYYSTVAMFIIGIAALFFRISSG
jgi:hypothetical protein